MNLNRRELLQAGAAAAAASLLAPNATAGYDEIYPYSPLIKNPFTEPLPRPLPQQPDPNGANWGNDVYIPGRHQIVPGYGNTLPNPILYKIPLKKGLWRPTNSAVEWLNPKTGAKTGVVDAALPYTTIFGFNGAFPGAMIYNRYYQPCVIRFVNELDKTISGQYTTGNADFGVEKFLTHLHNGHTASESDGNPNYMHHHGVWDHRNGGGWAQEVEPGMYLDNCYLNWPAGGDERECQSFCWFHDHQHGMTGPNVYKGMVGLFPMYYKADNGDERTGYRLPGVLMADGRIDYDIPMAFYDCRLDNGVAPNRTKFAPGGGHDGEQADPQNKGRLYWGRYPAKGFVGDIFTTNCVAYPYLEVKRRKYRLRFLGASLSRIYRLQIRNGGTLQEAPGWMGQWRYNGGVQCMKMVQVAAEGGLLPAPIVRDTIDIWPGKRREVVVDFSKYMDGSPTASGQVCYLVNTCVMEDGLKPDSWTTNNVPLVQFRIGDAAPDNSLILSRLRPLPPLPDRNTLLSLCGSGRRKNFHLGKLDKDYRHWGIRHPDGEMTGWDTPYEINKQAVIINKGDHQVWEFSTGGGWLHPMHMHHEEHRVIARGPENASDASMLLEVDKTLAGGNINDQTKEDIIDLGSAAGEGFQKVWIYRKFRTFTGYYVAHCHQLAHEDHSMMFGFQIVDPNASTMGD